MFTALTNTSFADRVSVTLLGERQRQLRAALDAAVQRRAGGDREMQAFQVRSLKALLLDAYQNVSFYRQKYDAAGFDPTTFETMDDLGRIPCVTRAELRRADLGALKNRAMRSPLWLLSSSGSTGTPLRLYREEKALWDMTARNLFLYFDWCALKPIANVLYFLDLTPGSIDHALADLLRTMVSEERMIGSNWPCKEMVDALWRYRPEFVSSYPSTMRNIATEMHRHGETWPGLQLLHLTSEMLDPGTRRLLGKVFPAARLVETYTASEAGLIAFPCAQSHRLHVAEDSVLCEIVDEAGRPTRDMGEIVVTDLTNASTPIIRYRGLGDCARWASQPCGCGSRFAAIERLEGRRMQSLVLPSGELLSPYAVIDALEEVTGVYQFQVIQQTRLQIEVRVIRDMSAGVCETMTRAAIFQAIGRLSPYASCMVRFVDQIAPAQGRHKVPLVICEIQESE